MRITDPAAGPAPATASSSVPATVPVRVLYIGGWGRSGSTLAERLLGEMADVTGAGEVTHLWLRGLVANEACACGEPFRSCPFWVSVGKVAFDGWETLDLDAVLALKRRVDRTRYVARLALPTRLTRRRAELLEYDDLYRRIYAAVAVVSGASVIVDSSKHGSLAFALRHHPGIDLRVLHLVRDGRGVAHSWRKKVRRPEIVGGETLMPQYSILKSGVLWTVHNLLFDALSMIGTRTLRLRYERMVADPARYLAEIRAFADLPPDPLAFLHRDGDGTVADLGTSHSVAGNPMRFQSGGVRVRSDDAWRRSMSPARRRIVTLLTWPGRLRYGYLDRFSKKAS